MKFHFWFENLPLPWGSIVDAVWQNTDGQRQNIVAILRHSSDRCGSSALILINDQAGKASKGDSESLTRFCLRHIKENPIKPDRPAWKSGLIFWTTKIPEHTNKITKDSIDVQWSFFHHQHRCQMTRKQEQWIYIRHNAWRGNDKWWKV